MEKNPSSARTDRNTIERNRRNQTKDLYSTLNSLVSHQIPMEAISLSDQLDEAINYIKRLQTNMEKMKERKNRLKGIDHKPPPAASATTTSSVNSGALAGLRSPQIEIHEIGSALEVVLITGLEFKFIFIEIIRLLNEEGVDIVNASFNVVEDTVFHSIHSKIGDSASAHGSVARISERLKKFVHDFEVYV